MRQILRNCVFMVVLLVSCTSKEEILKNRIDFLISNIKEKDFEKLYGHSAYSRGYDDVGNKYVVEIIFVDSTNIKFSIPSFQNLKNKSTKPSSDIDYIKYGKYFGKSKEESLAYAKLISNQTVEIITKYEIYGFNSQIKNGKTFGFEISEGLLVYFVEDLSKVKGHLKDSLNKAYRIKNKWYLLDYNEESNKVIDLLKRSNN